MFLFVYIVMSSDDDDRVIKLASFDLKICADYYFAERAQIIGRKAAGELFGRIGNNSLMLKAGLTVFDDCSCKHNEDFCSPTTIPWHCEKWQNDCSFVGIGCGWLWTGVCDGLCVGGLAE